VIFTCLFILSIHSILFFTLLEINLNSRLHPWKILAVLPSIFLVQVFKPCLLIGKDNLPIPQHLVPIMAHLTMFSETSTASYYHNRYDIGTKRSVTFPRFKRWTPLSCTQKRTDRIGTSNERRLFSNVHVGINQTFLLIRSKRDFIIPPLKKAPQKSALLDISLTIK